MRERTEQAMQKLRVAVAAVPLLARPFAMALVAVLECFNDELKGLKNGD